MKSLIAIIVVILCIITIDSVNGQPRFARQPIRQQQQQAAATNQRYASTPSYASAASSYTYPSSSSVSGMTLSSQQIATMLSQAQQMPLQSNMMPSSAAAAAATDINSYASSYGQSFQSPTTMMPSFAAVQQPQQQQHLQQQQLLPQQIQQQQSSSVMYGQQQAQLQRQQATPTQQQPQRVSSQQPIMATVNDMTAANMPTASTSGTAMTLDQLFTMYPDMRSQYAGAPSLPNGASSYQYGGVSQQQQASPIMASQQPQQVQQQQQPSRSNVNNVASPLPYTSYAPYNAMSSSSAGVPLPSVSSSSMLSSSPSFASPIINTNVPMAYIQDDFAGVANNNANNNNNNGEDDSQGEADNSYTTQGVSNDDSSTSMSSSSGCPSLADNPQLVSQGGNKYALLFAPTQSGQPISELQSVQVQGDINGRALSSSMDMISSGVWQSLINAQPGDTINWSYIFSQGNTNGNNNNNGNGMACQGQSYQSFIPMMSTNGVSMNNGQVTDASSSPASSLGPRRTLLGVPQQQQQMQQQPFQQQMQQPTQQQMQQQPIMSMTYNNDAAIRRPCPINAVHTTQISPLPFKTGRPIDSGATMYGVSFLANADISPVDYVDLHYSINSGIPWQQNIRMVRNATNQNRFDYAFGLPLQPSDELGIQFTYSSQYNDCDTPSESFSPSRGTNSDTSSDMNGISSQQQQQRDMMVTTNGLPTSIATSCPTITYSSDVPLLGMTDNGMEMFGLNFIGQLGAPVDFVETHYSVNNQPLQNYRMMASTPGMFEVQGIAMNRGDQLSYSFTHSINGVTCDTPVTTYINQGASYINNCGINTANRNNNNNGNSGNQLGVGISPLGTPAPIVNTACGRTIYTSRVSATPNNPKNIKPGSGNLYDLTFNVMDGAPVMWTDAHYTITRSPSKIQPWQVNDRMDAIDNNGKPITATSTSMNGVTSSSSFMTPSITLLPGDILGYSFTFQPSYGDACDTPTETFTLV